MTIIGTCAAGRGPHRLAKRHERGDSLGHIIDVLMSRGAFLVITAAALTYFVYDVSSSLMTFGFQISCWNLPNITVTVALIGALYLARQIDARMRGALHELWLQGTLPAGASPDNGLVDLILKGSARRELLAALLMMAVMIAAYAWSTTPYFEQILAAMMAPDASAEAQTTLLLSFFLPIGLGTAAGLVAGAFFGRLATYGSVAAVLARPETGLNIQPGHFDGANGLKPVGDFYLFQAVLTAIPLLWLSGWALALPWYHSTQCYADPIDPAYTATVQWQYYGQWLVIAGFTYVGFVRPVLELRNRLKRDQRDMLAKRVPEIEAEIASLNAGLARAADDSRRLGQEAAINELAKERWAIRNMRCWPMDKATFSKYAPVEIISNAAPLLLGPLLARAHLQFANPSFLPYDIITGAGSFLRRLFL